MFRLRAQEGLELPRGMKVSCSTASQVAGTERLSNHSFATAIDLMWTKRPPRAGSRPTQLETFSRKNWPT